MRLLSLSLDGQYKGLKDQTFSFDTAQGNIIAFIGLNGSGKSQLLELIAEVFAYAERTIRRDFTTNTGFNFSFSLAYELEGVRYKIKALQNKFPTFLIWKDHEWDKLKPTEIRLPNYIVGYSSGLNANLANAFLKNSVQYYQANSIRLRRRKELAGNINEEQFLEIDAKYLHRYPELFDNDDFDRLTETLSDISLLNYIDYDSARLAVASLAMLPRENLNKIFESCDSKYPEKIIFHYDLSTGQIEDDTVSDIKLLMRIAGEGYCRGLGGRTNEDLYERFELDYLSGEIVFDLTQDLVRSRFHELNYGQPLTFFKRLFKAQQLGVKKWGRQNTSVLKKDDFFGSIKKPLKNKLPITIQKLTLTNGVDSFVQYDDLSDGEAQLLEVLSLVRLFSSDNSKTLFLLDEPETHLNPSWRTHFHSYIEDAIDTDNKEVQLFISTHSPFMVSSLKRNNVYQFRRDDNGLINMKVAQNETYGASFDVLIKDLFELRSLISQSVIDDIREQLKQGDSHAKDWIEKNLGLSAEKAYLIRKLSS